MMRAKEDKPQVDTLQLVWDPELSNHTTFNQTHLDGQYLQGKAPRL